MNSTDKRLGSADGTVPTTRARTVAEAVARHGCSTVFGLMGDGNMALFLALDTAGVEVVEVRHESAAVAMAEGYAWSSGGVGVCSVTHGPGLTHVATSLVVAARNRSPLVLITAEVPTGYAGAQSFGQESFATACEAPYRRMAADEDPDAVVDEVMALAKARSRPVVLAVAADLFTGASRTRSTGPGGRHRPAGAVCGPTAEGAPATAVRQLTTALVRARRPVLIAGRGALGGAADPLRVLAGHLGAGLATTLPAKGLFDGHLLDLGIAGGLSHPAAERVLAEADVVVAVGAGMGRSTTQSRELFAAADVLRVLDEPPAVPEATALGTVVRGEATATMAEVARAVAAATGRRDPWFTPVGTSADCWQEDLDVYAPDLQPGTVDPRAALLHISEVIPRDAVVVVSNGHCSGFVSAFVTAPADGRILTAQGFGSIGQAMTSAIGAARGAPGQKVVVFEGDAAFMMHAQELDTAARTGVDLTVFVLNDQALGTEYQRLRRDGDGAELAVVPPPDLAVLARALGARAWTIDEHADARATAEAALNQSGPALVDIRTARTVLSRHMRLPGPRQGTPAGAHH
ncbi:thiamine pyrophosphate-dependent enzyme [Streptomyces sp. NPDC023723]|uniref:thiamine pyrophosphate-binding protein n=1 Tax=Streptomyces sp. NPDC023723 TaxID=3154323 RepID=UPI0033FDE59A